MIATPEKRQYPPVSWDRRACHCSISFVVVHYSDDLNHNFLCSPDIYRACNEIITVDNRLNVFYSSLGAALNAGMARAVNDLIAIVHEDVLLAAGWQEEFERSLAALEAVDPDWGMVGAVGWGTDGRHCGHWSDPHQYGRRLEGRLFAQVERLDEQLLVVQRRGAYRFDENLPGIHALGNDAARTLAANGRRTYVVDAPTLHKYADATGAMIVRAAESVKIRSRSEQAPAMLRECAEDYFHLKTGVRPRPRVKPTVPLTELACTSRPEGLVLLVGMAGRGFDMLSGWVQAAGLGVAEAAADSGGGPRLADVICKSLFQKFVCTDQRQRDFTQKMLISALGSAVGEAPDEAPCTLVFPEGLLLPELLEALPSLRIVHLVRDPLSLLRTAPHATCSIDHALGQAVLPHAYRALGRDPARILEDEDPIRVGTGLAFEIGVAAAALAGRPAIQTFQLRFEALCSDPERETRALCNWMGVRSPEVPIIMRDEGEGSIGPAVRADLLDHVKRLLRPSREALGYL